MLESLEKLDPICECRTTVISRGYHDSLGLEVAIKELKEPFRNDAHKSAAFFDEARNLARLNYEHILKVHDLNEKAGWVVTELMEGSLADLIAQGPMPADRVRSVMQQVLRALNFLHNDKTLYGKVRPSKLLYNRRGRIKLGLFNKIGSSLMPVPEDAKYIAPETIDARFGDIGPQMDLYCLGFTALELLTGPQFNSQFQVMADDEAMARIGWLRWHTSDQTLPSVAKLVPDAPNDLVQVIDACLIKEVSRRPATALEAFAKLDPVPLIPVIEGGEHSIALPGRASDPLGVGSGPGALPAAPPAKPPPAPVEKPDSKTVPDPAKAKPKLPPPSPPKPAPKPAPAKKPAPVPSGKRRSRRARQIFAWLFVFWVLAGGAGVYWYGRGVWWPPYPTPDVPPVLIEVTPKEAEVVAGDAHLSRDASGKVILPNQAKPFSLVAKAAGFRDILVPDMTMERLKTAGYKVELQPDPNYFFEIGKKEFEASHFPPAIEAFDKVLKTDPKFTEAYFYRGSARFQGNDFPGAVQDLTEYLNSEPGSPKRNDILFARGSAHAKLGKADEAIQDLDEVFAKTPRDDVRAILGKLYFDRGTSRLVAGKVDDAVTDFESATKISPDNASHKSGLAEALFRRAQQKLARHDYGSALVDLNHVLELDKSRADVLAVRSECQHALGENDKALADITAAIELKNSKVEYYVLRARLYRALKQPEKAIDDLATAIKLQKDFAEAYAERGLILDKDLGQYEAAIENYKQALANGYKPAFPVQLAIADDLLHLAQDHVDNGQYAQAIDEYGKSISLLETIHSKASADEQGAVLNRVIESHRGLGMVFGYQRKYQEAIDEFGKAITESGEKDYKTYEMRARVYLRMNDFSAALEDCKSALKLNKEYWPASLLKAQVKIKEGSSYIDARNNAPAAKRDTLTKDAIDDYRLAIMDLVVVTQAQPDSRLAYEQMLEALDLLGQVVGDDPAIARDRAKVKDKLDKMKKK